MKAARVVKVWAEETATVAAQNKHKRRSVLAVMGVLASYQSGTRCDHGVIHIRAMSLVATICLA